MSIWSKFNSLQYQMPDTKDAMKVPGQIKQAVKNTNANKIAIRYFTNNFHYMQEVVGEITRDTDIPLVIFDSPIKGAILLIDDFTFINTSRNNELTIDISENYPFGIDKNSDLIKFEGVDYYNTLKDFVSEKFLGKSKSLYYSSDDGEKRKFYVPVMLNQIPLPIIRLDNADRLNPVSLKYARKLANITQSFLRAISDVKLLQRVGKKDSTGMIFVAVLFILIGIIGGIIIRGFI